MVKLAYSVAAIAIISTCGSVANAQRWMARVPEGTTVHRDLAYVANGHERQRLDLYLPEASNAPRPVIVWVHGGGWQGGSKENPSRVLPFVSEGYAVASVNYRLSQHAIFPAQIHDCKAAIRWLRAHADEYNLDADHIGVWGASAGGHLVALLGTSGDVPEIEGDLGNNDQSSRVQAVVDLFGPTDLAKMGGMHNRPRSPEARLIGGLVQDKPKEATAANPITYVSKDDPPFLIMHGDKDPLVPLNQSELLNEALAKAEVQVELVVVKGAGHGGEQFVGAGNGPLIEQIETFFAKHLKGAKGDKASKP